MPTEEPGPLPGARGPSNGFDIFSFLSNFLGGPKPGMLAIIGPAGSGKSTFLRSLVPRLRDPKAFIGFSSPHSIPTGRGDTSRPDQSVAVLLIHPDWSGQVERSGTEDSARSSSLAFAPVSESSDPTLAAPLGKALARLASEPGATVIVDSWDRGSEEFFRADAGPSAVVEKFTASMIPWAGVHSAILSSSVRFVVTALPDSATPLASLADAIVLLHEEPVGEVRLRIASIPKVRGTPPPAPDHLYTLEDGTFRLLPAIPRGHLPEAGPADPDPTPTENSLWPGSAAFARAFGRLRYRGLTGVQQSQDCPDGLVHVLAVPISAHVLRAGGRVVWVPPPSVPPSSILDLVRPFVPPEALREGFRLLIAPRDESTDPGSSVNFLSAAPHAGIAAQPLASPTSVGSSLFPELHRFLDAPAPTAPSLLVVSLAGLRSCVAAAGGTYGSDTTLVWLGEYARVPQSHAIAWGPSSDPVGPLVRTAADSLLDLNMVLGRPILSGSRPLTAPFALDWPNPEGAYDLVRIV
jgi:molybdopterin-guanine dinucleotide biosynthesis protein